jgi:D-arabinose 5-phosphate isomerase GutQ
MVNAWLARQTAGAGRPVHPVRAMAVATPVATPADVFPAASAAGEGH